MIKSILMLFVLTLAGCRLDTEKGSKMNNESVKVHCVGRHQIAIPSSFSVSPISTGIFKIQGAEAQDPEIDVIVHSDITTKLKFDSAIQQRRSELSRSESKTTNLLKLDKTLPDGNVLFRVQEIEDAYFSEIYFLRESAMVKIKLESYGGEYLKAEEQMSKLAMAITERDLSTKIGSSEFCLGPLLLKANLSQEIASFSFRDGQGLALEIDVDTFSQDDATPLLARMSGEDSLLNKFKVRHEVLRARERNLAGMKADEWLGIGYLGEGSQGRRLKFALETKRKNPTKSTPSIVLTLNSGQPLSDGTPATTRIEDEDTVDLWDRIVESIQLRSK